MSSYFVIKLGVYPFDVMVSVDETDESISKRLIKYGNTKEEIDPLLNLSETTNGRCVMLPSNQTIIRLKTLKNKYDMMGVVSHEAFHATAFILSNVGMKLELYTSDEAYAYMISFITTEIYKNLNL